MNFGNESSDSNYLDLPEEIDFDDGNLITYIYDAAGVKHAKIVTDANAGINYKYYIGNMEYNNAKVLEYIHTEEGRVRLADNDFIYDLYLKDHLGNTRVVFNQNSSGALEVELVDNYYPFGMRFNQTNLIADQTTDYLYNGKELQEDHGLDWYDYGARFYDPSLGHWHNIDPLAANYLSNSPYHYSYNNPIRFIDPDGRKIVDKKGNEVEVTINEDKDGNKSASFEFAEGTKKHVKRKFKRNGGKIVNETIKSEKGEELVNAAIESKDNIHLNLSSGAPSNKLGQTISTHMKTDAKGNKTYDFEITVFKETISNLTSAPDISNPMNIVKKRTQNIKNTWGKIKTLLIRKSLG